MKKLLFGATVLLGLLAVACGGGDNATTTPSVSATKTAAATTAAATATVTPAATATAAPSAAAKQFTSQMFADALTMTADSSWSVDTDNPNWYTLKHAGDATYPAGFIDIFVPTQAYQDNGIDTEAVPSDLVAFLEGNKFLTEQDKSPVTVGGLSGTQLDMGSSASDEFKLFKIGTDDYTIAYADRIRFEVLNGPTGPIVIGIGTQPPAQAEAFKPQAQSVVDTLTFQ